MTSDYQKFCNSIMVNDELYYKKVSDKIELFSYGCQDSIWDLETITEMIDEDKLEKPIVFIDTCCAIDLQENISKRVVDRVTRLYKDTHTIYITGCGISYDKEYYKDKGILLDNSKKFLPSSYQGITKNDFTYNIFRTHHINGHIKISDGCNYNCAYCAIKNVRPHYEFDYYNCIYQQVECSIKNGYTDICLFGTEICSFRFNGFNLVDLISKILQDFPEIISVKLDTIHPAFEHIDELIDLIKKEPKLHKELDLGIQSCSDRVLKLMKRPYNLKKIEHIVEKAQGLDIDFQLITGFPGETEECFNETYEAIKRLKPSRITLCPFSARKGTEAYTMHNKIPHSIAKEREEKLIELVKNSVGKKIENKSLAAFNSYNDCSAISSFKIRADLYNIDDFVCIYRYIKKNQNNYEEFVVETGYDKNGRTEDLDINIKLLMTALGVKVVTTFDIDDETIKSNYPWLISNYLATFVNFEFDKLTTATEKEVVNFFKDNEECVFDKMAISKFIKAGNKRYTSALTKAGLI